MADVVGWNAIAWAQFRLKGGWRRVAIVASLYGLALVFGLGMTRRLLYEEVGPTRFFQGWEFALLGLQAFALVFFIAGQITGAIRKDITTEMLASHRLMPISGTEAVAGYILGQLAQPLAVAGVTFFFGMMVAEMGKLSVAGWIHANALLVSFAVFLWVVSAFTGLLSQAGFGVAIAFGSFTAMGQGWLLAALPGTALLCPPAIGPTAIGVVKAGMTWGVGYQAALVTELFFGILCYAAAARRFRRDDVLAVNPPIGLAMTVGWLAASAVAILNWAAISPFGMRSAEQDIQIAGSMAIGLVLGVITVSAQAWMEAVWVRRAKLRDPGLERRPMSPNVFCIGLAAVLSVFPLMAAASVTPWSTPGTFLAALIALLTGSYLVRLLYLWRDKAASFLVFWIICVWAIPLGAGSSDVMRELGHDEWSELLVFLSPLRALRADISSSQVPMLAVGLVVNALLLGGLFFLYHWRRRRGTPTG